MSLIIDYKSYGRCDCYNDDYPFSILGSFFIFMIGCIMSLIKSDKIKLAKDYQEMVSDYSSIVVLSYNSIPVSEINKLRQEIASVGWEYKVVKKRVLARSLQEAGYELESVDKLEWSIAILMYNEDIAPLKQIDTYLKSWKKDKKKYTISYAGGWFDKSWQEGDYVKVLSTLPGKEELISKLLFMLNYPIQGFAWVGSNLLSSFVRVLDQVKDKK